MKEAFILQPHKSRLAEEKHCLPAPESFEDCRAEISNSQGLDHTTISIDTLGLQRIPTPDSYNVLIVDRERRKSQGGDRIESAKRMTRCTNSEREETSFGQCFAEWRVWPQPFSLRTRVRVKLKETRLLEVLEQKGVKEGEWLALSCRFFVDVIGKEEALSFLESIKSISIQDSDSLTGFFQDKMVRHAQRIKENGAVWNEEDVGILRDLVLKGRFPEKKVGNPIPPTRMSF
uniref:Uncharacterized protein n=1 Tax=Chromera velia CCMP2878 TaxID=1169474 RepID=A0A0G4FES0_9ALVE|eukprot:Cvel_3261.t1-p1 / transcript=Cvel_3261.t1 / gene=Cvel_3261 / organism=Chromera_velia_CCMP2878 / gene_product=hypothetical protein / transcript_product=hypothetical protein / location=Cvel_scaffold128:34338-35665(-) / protein_length=231 / sequence_SO=supercontig / SO=protein_coding / is_pseudo=false